MLSREVAAGIVYRVLRKKYDLLASWQDGILLSESKKGHTSAHASSPAKTRNALLYS